MQESSGVMGYAPDDELRSCSLRAFLNAWLMKAQVRNNDPLASPIGLSTRSPRTVPS